MGNDDVKRFQTDNYLVLKPDEVSVWEMIRLLFWSKKMQIKAFISLPPDPDKQRRLLENGLAITSLSAQKLLRHAVKLFNLFGEIEMLLNLVSFNRNIFMLLLNIFTCKLSVPNRKSDDFVSLIGHLDSRVELDKNIKRENPRYNSALAAMAAKLAYENKGFVKKTVEQHWKMEFIDMDFDFWNDYQEKHNTQAFMFHDHDQRVNKIVVAFRGTEPFNAYDWSTDADISCFSNQEMGKIHGGFMKALGLVMNEKKDESQPNGWPPKLSDEQIRQRKNYAYYTIREELRRRLGENKEAKFIVTGHSLGGALAILFPAILALHQEDTLLQRLEGVYTFGQPRVGDSNFKNFMEHQFRKYGIKYLRFVYCNDLIPRLPPFEDLVTDQLYTHFGTCLYFNSCYRGQTVDKEPNKNYFSCLGWMARFLNALLELLRSLYLPLVKGKEYRESLAQIFLVRFPALVFPRMADHNPQDYVNATRLGSLAAFQQAESPITPTQY